jgi:hypothetical protein
MSLEHKPPQLTGRTNSASPGSELLIRHKVLARAWNLRERKRRAGAQVYWVFQHTNTPILHHSSSSVFLEPGGLRIPLSPDVGAAQSLIAFYCLYLRQVIPLEELDFFDTHGIITA